MEIIRQDFASIKHNDPNIIYRVQISLAREIIDSEESYFLITDDNEDCGPHFKTEKEAIEAIDLLWGKSAEWDLQYE